jgi:hypothetical protein
MKSGKSLNKTSHGRRAGLTTSNISTLQQIVSIKSPIHRTGFSAVMGEARPSYEGAIWPDLRR